MKYPQTRAIKSDLTAVCNGVTWFFPDARPTDRVVFQSGQPASESAVPVPRDRYGFDLIPENSAASQPPARNRHRTTHVAGKTRRWGSLSKSQTLALYLAGIVLVLLPGWQIGRSVHTHNAGEGRGDAIVCQAVGDPSAFCNRNVDKRKPCHR